MNIPSSRYRETSTDKLSPGARLLLGIMVISAFLSEAKFIPGIRNNIGPFEFSGLLFISIILIHYYRDNIKLYAHPLIFIVGWWFLLAFTSLLWVQPDNIQVSFVQAIVFLFQFFFLLVMYNVLLRDPDLLLYLLRWFAAGLIFISVWVLLDQIANGGSLVAVGPFRGRSQMGIYMFGAFWILLIYSFWPGLRRWERLLTYPILALVAYIIAISLRQSVYTAFILGLVGLAASFLIVRGRERLKIILPILFVVGIVAVLYLYGGQSFTSVNLFRRELLGLNTRLEQVTVSTDDPGGANSFDALQRRGAIKAFVDHPVNGIGWQGFYHSAVYSATGNELHSTPWRLLAELGLLGFIPYLVYLAILLVGSMRLFWLARPTPYQLSAMVMMVALFSVTVSHYYNRMFTDRPYWFLLAVFLALEIVVKRQTNIVVSPQTKEVANHSYISSIPGRRGR